MQSWKGKRLLAVATACIGSDGVPTFAYTEVAVTLEEYRNGIHVDLVEERLVAGHCDEPYVHFLCGIGSYVAFDQGPPHPWAETRVERHIR
jgi:hypothetical protein